MKTVFNTRQCAHVWAQQTQFEGRNASNSVHFRDRTFYSYATPIAAIVETKSRTVALVTVSRLQRDDKEQAYPRRSSRSVALSDV